MLRTSKIPEPREEVRRIAQTTRAVVGKRHIRCFPVFTANMHIDTLSIEQELLRQRSKNGTAFRSIGSIKEKIPEDIARQYSAHLAAMMEIFLQGPSMCPPELRNDRPEPRPWTEAESLEEFHGEPYSW